MEMSSSPTQMGVSGNSVHALELLDIGSIIKPCTPFIQLIFCLSKVSKTIPFFVKDFLAWLLDFYQRWEPGTAVSGNPHKVWFIGPLTR